MKRLVFGLGAVAIVAAALAGYLLFGDEEMLPVTAENATEQQAVDRAEGVDEGAAPPQAPPSQESEGSDQKAADLTIGSDAAEETSPAPADQSARPQVVSRSDPDAVVSPDAPAPSDGPTFDVVRVEPSGEAVIAGRAAPESEVTVTLGEGGTVGTAKADRSGAWAIVAEQPLAPGSHQIGIEAKTPQGEKQLSDNLVVVMVPEAKAPPGAGAADKPAEADDAAAAQNAAAPVLAVLTPRAGDGASKVLPQGPAEGIAAGSLVLDSVDYDATGRAILGGRARPGARMLIYLDNRPIGEAVAGEDGRWTLSPASPILEGLHDLRVDEVDASGTVVARIETPFSRERARPIEAGDDYVIVQPGNSLWRIARRTYGRGIRYTVIYEANAAQIRDPDLIYPGQVFALPRRN